MATKLAPSTWESPDRQEAVAASSSPKRPFLFRWLQKNRHALNDFVARSSKISNAPLLDPADFDWTGPVAQEWETIRDEALAIYRHVDAIPPLRELSPDHRGIIADDNWRSFFLIGYGNVIHENIARAPNTARILERIPGVNSAFFSILAPGAHISRHRGVAKSFFTAHLGLVVPDEAEQCVMQVEEDFVHWRNGEWVIFDDTYEHEVWNRTDQKRIILLLQVSRPLRAPGSWIASFFMWYLKRSPFVTEAKRELSLWEDAFAEAERLERQRG